MRRVLILMGVLAGVAGCKDDKPALDPAAVARGETVFESCAACHAVEHEENRIGPHLVNVVGRKAGSVEGYAYSDALAGSGITWTPEELTAFVLDPLGRVEGTKMALGEITQVEAADVVVYLQSLAD